MIPVIVSSIYNRMKDRRRGSAIVPPLDDSRRQRAVGPILSVCLILFIVFLGIATSIPSTVNLGGWTPAVTLREIDINDGVWSNSEITIGVIFGLVALYALIRLFLNMRK